MSRRAELVSYDQIAEALALRDHDPIRWTYAALAHRYGISYARFYYALYPDRKEGRNERRKRKRLLMRRTADERLLATKAAQLEIRRRLMNAPVDTRDLTGRLMGDPIRPQAPVFRWNNPERPHIPARCVWRFGGKTVNN